MSSPTVRLPWLLFTAAAALLLGLAIPDVPRSPEELRRWWHAQQVRAGALAIEERPTEVQALVVRGAACFRDHCAACHGAPGVDPRPEALALRPPPRSLADAAHRWNARELVWIARNGLPAERMPGFAGRLEDHDLWALAAFLRQLPRMTPERYATWQRQAHGLPCTPLDAPEPPADRGVQSPPSRPKAPPLMV